MRAQRTGNRIEYRQGFDRVDGTALLPLAFQCRPIVQGVEQSDRHEDGQYDQRRHARCASCDAPPGQEQMRLAADVCEIARDRADQQPDQHIRGEQNRHHSSLTRGSTSV
jgi:hypothetical protein